MTRLSMNPASSWRAAAALAMLLLGACHPPADSAHHNRGIPQSLLDVSSEVVNLSVASKDELKELSQWINGDQPSRAELFCDASAPSCKEAQKILQVQGVETNVTPSMNNTVTLVYERILARDCNARYVGKFSLYNEPPPSFGCAIAANTVQHVSDKREFINPSLSDDPSAIGAVNAYRRAMAPQQANTQQGQYGVTNSAVSSSSSGGGTQ